MNTLIDASAAIEAESAVATSFDPSSPAALAEDRRRSERVAQQVPGWISGESTDRGAKGHKITVNDLSMHGVGFHDAGSTQYRRGASHWLVVVGGAMRMSTRVRIASCRPNPNGGFDVGAAFF